MATDIQGQFAALHRFVGEEDFAQALGVCEQILKISEYRNDQDAIKSKVICLVKLDRYADALATCNAATSVNLQFERAYSLYRLQRFEEALQICSAADSSPAIAHLRGQLLYRMGRYDECANIYSNLMDAGTGTDVDLKINTYAAFTSAGKAEEVLQDYPIDEADMEESFELRFNLASAYISSGNLEAAAQELTRAMATVERVLKEEDVPEEQAPMKLQLAFINHKLQRGEEAINAYTDVLRNHKNSLELSAVAANNLAALRGDKDLPDSLRRLRSTINKDAEAKLSYIQLRTIRYNRCLLLLLMRKADECLRTLDELEAQYGKTARAAMIRAAAFAHSNRWQDCDAVVDAALVEYRATPARDELQLFKAQTLIIRGNIAVATDILEGIASLQVTPALVSALYALFAFSNDREKMLQVLANAKKNATQGIADETSAGNLISKIAAVYESMGMHSEASEAYIQMLDSASLDADERLTTVARLVCVLSRVDNDTAELHASYLPQINADDIVADTLEQAELPRSRAKGLQVKETKVVVEKAKRTMTTEQKARKKAKAKAAYLAKLTEQGRFDPRRPTFPDPERWVSRKQRSFGKRGRKNRMKFSGAQGSGDGALKDASRLDAAKRAADAKAKEAEAKPAHGRRRPGGKK